MSGILRAAALAGLLVLGLSAPPPVSAQLQPNDLAGDAFYTPPSPLPPAEHGAVIRSRPLDTAAVLPSAARNVLILYYSMDLDGRAIAVSGTLAIPPGTPPEGGWPLITWTHGTTGLADICAPSRDRVGGPAHEYLAFTRSILDEYVKRGYAVAATDYEGLGTPGLHPYLQGGSEARGALDIMRAAREIDPRIGTRYVVMGHSQGGQADLFTASLGPDYVPELTPLGNVAIAPASHLAERVEGIVRGTSPTPALAYAMYVLESFASNHPAIDLPDILTPEALAHLGVTREECMSSTMAAGYWKTAIPKDQFLPGADLGPVLQVAARNDPGNLRISVPTLLMQGTADQTVAPAETDAFARALCEKNNIVLYRVYPGATHVGVVTAGAPDAQAWIEARFRGEPPENNCNALPSAAEVRN